MLYLFIIQIGLAVILLLAAAGKLLDGEQFLAVLRLSHLPEQLIKPIAILTPLFELTLAVGLVLSFSGMLPFVMASTLGLFIVFTGWMVWVHAKGLRLKCGCFGTGESNVGLYTIVRNCILIAASLGGFILALFVRSPIPPPSYWMVITVVTFGLSIVLLQSLVKGRSSLVLSISDLERLERQQMIIEGSEEPQQSML